MAKRISGAALCLLLAGCSFFPRAGDARDLDLAVVLAVDAGEEYTVTALTSAGQETPARCLSASGETVARAVEALRAVPRGGQVSLHHVARLIVSTNAASALGEITDLWARDPELRLGMEVYFTAGSAGEMLERAAEEDRDLSSELALMKKTFSLRSTALGRAAALLQERGNCTLVCIGWEGGPEPAGEVLLFADGRADVRETGP